MKKIKILFLVFALWLLSGCSIQYNLNFEDSSFKENIKVTLAGADYRNDKITNLKDFNLLAISKGLEQKEYEKEFSDSDNQFLASYTYEYRIEDFNKNNILNQCYDSFSLLEENNYYLLSTGKQFDCLSIEYQTVHNYEINITTNHKVLEHNADKVNNGKYTWIIKNDDNKVSTQKPIMIKFSKEIKEGILDNNISMILIAFATVLLIGGIIFLIAYNRNKKSNKL